MRMSGQLQRASWKKDSTLKRSLSSSETKAFSSKANSKKPNTKTPNSPSHSKNYKKNTSNSKKPTPKPNENPKNYQIPTKQPTSTAILTKNKKLPPSTKPASKVPTTNWPCVGPTTKFQFRVQFAASLHTKVSGRKWEWQLLWWRRIKISWAKCTAISTQKSIKSKKNSISSKSKTISSLPNWIKKLSKMDTC